MAGVVFAVEGWVEGSEWCERWEEPADEAGVDSQGVLTDERDLRLRVVAVFDTFGVYEKRLSAVCESRAVDDTTSE